jgi:hypothetical protein
MSRGVAIVSGTVAGNLGQGGAAWAVLQYVLGLQALGYEVMLIEPLRSTPEAPLRSTPAAVYFDHIVSRFGLRGHACVLRTATAEVHGLDRDEYDRIIRRADILLNIAGMLPLEPPLDSIPVRAYLDLDPGFNQFWQTVYGIDMGFAGHTHHVTVGLCVGQPDCLVPTCDVSWIPTLPPIDLRYWPVAPTLRIDALTTVGNWRSYGPIEVEGVHYGQKAHSVRALLPLGRRSPKRLHVALAIHPAEVRDHAALAAAGWCVADPAVVASTPDDYHDFIGGSWGELGIAKAGYVAARTGWFSDRSAGYLASGRPVIAQDTGFSNFLPTDAGLVAFDDVASAVDCITRVAGDYEFHRRAARRFAECHLDARRVLSQLLCRLGVR